MIFLLFIMSGVASTLAKKRALSAGFGTNANAVPYLNQNFNALRAQCRSAGKLFCDPTFPAAPESLGFNELGPSSYKVRGVSWKRPTVRTGTGGGEGWLCLMEKHTVWYPERFSQMIISQTCERSRPPAGT